MSVRCMVKYNPQWELEVVLGKIVTKKVAIENMHLPSEHAALYT